MKSIQVVVVKNGKQYEIRYKEDRFDTQPKLLHALPDKIDAKLYAEGVIDGLLLGRTLLRVNRYIGKQTE